MTKSIEKSYWEDFFAYKDSTSKTSKDLTRNEVLMSMFCDAIENKYLVPTNAKRILEVGCGQSIFSIYMAKKGYETFGVDFSNLALSLSKKTFVNSGAEGHLFAGDVLHLPFASGSFDVVYSGGLLDIFDRPVEPLREMARVLQENGLLLAIIPTRRFSIQKVADCFNNMVHGVKTLIGKPSSSWKTYRRTLGHAKNNSIADYRTALVDAGFEPLRMTTGYPVPELSMPAFMKRGYVRWLVNNRKIIRGQIFSNNPIRVSLGIYYYVFAKKMLK